MDQFDYNAFQHINETEKRYNMMLMKSPFAFSVMKGDDMVIFLANDHMKEFWGKGKNVEGKKLLEVLPELKDQLFPEMINRAYNTGFPVYANEILAKLTHRGKLENHYFNIVYQPYFEADETISGVTTIAYEVTEMVLARKKIEESELHFRKLADLMPSKISNADADGNVIYFNQHWLDYTGMSFEELKDFGYHKIMHPEELEEFQKRFEVATKTQTILEMEMRFMNKEGNYKWHLNLATPIIDEEGKIKMWIGSTTQMHEQITQKAVLEAAVEERTTALEKANKELIFENIEKEKRAIELNTANKELAYQSQEKENRAAELFIANEELLFQNEEKEKRALELIAANNELSAFNYISSHDLQEPLRKLQMFETLILQQENENLSENGKSIFNRMRLATDRMRQLIEDLLTFSHINSTERKFEKTELGLIVEDVQKDLKHIIKQKHATIKIIEICPAHIINFQFRQLIYNLLSNSLKFAKEEGHPEIIITCKIVKGSELNIQNLNNHINYCHITFSDNGIGFDTQHRHRIFEVFQRLHSQKEYGGTGIGLAIVKKIVENHNGIITASGELNKGARFDIYIPEL